MIVSRKDKEGVWANLEDYSSRLSGPYYESYYRVNNSWHRLYGRSYKYDWDLNNKFFEKFKGV